MKRCIVALLLGFDEVEVFKSRYSSPTATVQKMNFLPELKKPPRYKVSPLDYDSVTIFHAQSAPDSSPSTLPKYEYCIAISLLEPFSHEPDAHKRVFEYVKTILSSIPGGEVGFKMIIRHHSTRGEMSDRLQFDHKLMQNRFVPGSHVHGFEPQKTYDARFDERAPLTLDQATALSAEITKRTHDSGSVPVKLLAYWVRNIVPMSYVFPAAANPLRITMGGCYAGFSAIDSRPLIEYFVNALRQYFESSFITVIGSIAWTFYDDWRAISFCDEYLEHEPNTDPFRGVPLENEQDFFVKIPDDMRRHYTRQVTWNPQERRLAYGLRPEKIPSGQKMEPPNIAFVEQKAKMFNCIMIIGLETTVSVPSTRVPDVIARVMHDISRILAPASDYDQFFRALKQCISQLEMQVQALPEKDIVLTQFIPKVVQLLKYYVFIVLDERWGKLYKKIYGLLEQIFRWLKTLPEKLLNQYTHAIDACSKTFSEIPPLSEAFIDSAKEEDTEAESEVDELNEILQFYETQLKHRDLNRMLVDEKTYFSPLLSLVGDFYTDVIQLLLLQTQNTLPRYAGLIRIEAIWDDINGYLDQLKRIGVM